MGNSRTAAFAAVRLPRGQRRAKQGGAGSTAPPRLVNLLGKEKPPLLLLRGPGEGL